eukprot:COSAG02_NODE_17060_length_1031_cov_6.252212_2_plen_64_part_01
MPSDEERARKKRCPSPVEDGPVLTETDLYRLLRVGRDADNGTIKKAYYRLSKKYHPDKGGHEED